MIKLVELLENIDGCGCGCNSCQDTAPMTLKTEVSVSKELKYHLDKNIPLHEQVFRIGSEKYNTLINEVRELYTQDLIELCKNDQWIVNTDAGKVLEVNGQSIVLDTPFINEEYLNEMTEAEHRGRKVKLNSPFRTSGGPKKFAVYVRNPKTGKIKKVTFGDPNLRVKNYDKAAAKSFRARHKCDQKKDRTKAGYWACNVNRYAKKLGLSSKRKW